MPLLSMDQPAQLEDKRGGPDKNGAPDKRGEADKRGGGMPLKVSVVVVKPEPFAETINSTGTLRADESVELQAETNGKVVAIKFTEGAAVHKGDLLVKLNDGELRASHARATFSAELAKVNEHRLDLLLKEGVAKRVDYDTALSAMHVQEADIQLIEAQIAKTEIRAPFDGTVGLRYVSEGAFVNANARIATLQRVDKLKLDFAIPEKYAGRIELGSPVTFTVAGGDRTFRGEIYAYDPRIDTVTRTVLIRAVCSNPNGSLLPGAFANVEMTLTQLDSAILIPAVAVIPGLNEKNVFVLKNGKAARHPVETGTRTATSVHILSGLSAGDIVITSGLQQMRDGLTVQAEGAAVAGTDKDNRHRDASSDDGHPAPSAEAANAVSHVDKPL
jgi:membrane fusion protein (multidrug efflux system)